MKKLLLPALVISLLLIIGCLFVRSNWDLWRFSGITELEVAEGNFELKDSGRTVLTRGVVVPFGEFLVGLNHCFMPRICMRMFGCYVIDDDKIEKVEFTLGGQKIEILAKVDDVVIFSRPENSEYRLPVKWGKSEDLRVGDRVLSIGYSGFEQINVREGIVSAINQKEKVFFVSISGYGGDSGTPVLYLKNGDLLIGGLLQSVISGADYARVIDVDFVREVIKGII